MGNCRLPNPGGFRWHAECFSAFITNATFPQAIATAAWTPWLLAIVECLVQQAEGASTQVLAYLDVLAKRYRFTVLDMTSLSSFGGSPRLFYDGFHLTIPNMHRLLDTLVRKERRAL